MKKLIFTLLTISMFTGCAKIQVVEHNEDKVDLADYTTVAWADGPVMDDTAIRLKAADEAIRSDVEAALVAKGYEIVGDDAEVLVSWRLGHREFEMAKQPVYSIDQSFGDESMRDEIHAGDVFLGGADYVNVDIMLILFSDAKTRKPLVALEVRGVGDAGTGTADDANKRIDQAISKAMKKIPSH